MKICVLTHTYPRFPSDPVAPFMRYFCYGVAESGNEVFLLAPYDPAFVPKDKKISITLYKYIFLKKLHSLGYSRTLIGDHRFRKPVYFLAPFIFIFSLFSLLRLVRQKKIQLISAHWIVPNGFIGALVSKITGVPLVVTIPGSDMYLAKINIVFRLMAKIAIKQAKVVVSNSMEYIKEFSRFGITITNGTEIPYGINPYTYSHIRRYRKVIRKKSGCTESDFVILAVGRLVEKKGFEYLIAAMPRILREKKRAKLLIIGEGSERSRYEKLISSLRLEGNVILLGTINYAELPKYYSAADLYVAPSIRDPSGNMESHIVALFEAFASGLPIVATNLAVSNQYLIDGINGYHVREKNTPDLARAICKIMRSPNLQAMGRQSKKIAKEKLSYQHSGKLYSELFKKAVTPFPKDS